MKQTNMYCVEYGADKYRSHINVCADTLLEACKLGTDYVAEHTQGMRVIQVQECKHKPFIYIGKEAEG